MKTITLEEIYADPHMLEPLLAGHEAVRIVQEGKPLGTLAPTIKAQGKDVSKPIPKVDFKARFLQMHGPDAFKSTRTTADIFELLRGEAPVNRE